MFDRVWGYGVLVPWDVFKEVLIKAGNKVRSCDNRPGTVVQLDKQLDLRWGSVGDCRV